MICKRCKTKNPDRAYYCTNCGAPLIKKPEKKKNSTFWYLPAAGSLLLIAAIYITFQIISDRRASADAGGSGTQTSAVSLSAVGEGRAVVPVAYDVIIWDVVGEEVARLGAPVASGEWIAIPTWACFGGESLTFHRERTDDIQVEEGIWTPGDPVILGKLETRNGINSLELNPWQASTVLKWRATRPDGPILRVEAATADQRGNFRSCPLPKEINEPGVFLQNGRIVGWTFGAWLEKGYLWVGPSGDELIPNLSIDQFYAQMFSNCREAQFNKALNLGENTSAAERLEAFAEGFRMDAQFTLQDTPVQLKPRPIIGYMDSLARELIENGYAEDVARSLDELVISEAGDILIIKNAVLAQAEYQDYKRAIDFLEQQKSNLFNSRGQSLAGLDQFHAKLYKDWLREINEKGGPYSGLVAFEEAKKVFPDDVELHLLGVEIAIKERNWEMAEELIRARDYSLSLQAWAERLEEIITDRRGDDQTVVIRFNPGSTQIPVEAYINGTYFQRFFLDTGAASVSIPSSTANALGIEIDSDTPVRRISTAGGISLAYEVTLDVIELEGLSVYNLKTLIIDLPGAEDYGLLGNSFLSHFHVEIDNKKGILKLKPR